MLYLSTADAIRTIKREFKDLSGSQLNLGIARALNRTIRSGRAAASKEIRQIWKIRAKDIKAAQSIRTANRNDLKATLLTTGRPIPLMAFGPTFTRKGVSVNIGGQRKYLPGAFKATMKSGHVGIFGRGVYNAGKFDTRRKRIEKWPGNDNPITEMKTLSVPVATRQDAVLRHIGRKVTEDFPKRLTHELLNIRRATTADPGGG